ncbi:ATP-dependent nuclease [Leucothrix mucor]|uniref:ATP-dependent nuclease n=1 Tax=Leucothrix mucor TaxID=45248 RepID=UPI0003B6972B|nr:AAA family ATPase [Leucothrix mucor]
MIIKYIEITNYRGIKEKQQIPLNNYTSVVGQNDAGKSIVLSAIATFLDPKNHPISSTDFNDPGKQIEISCQFSSDDLRSLLESKVKSKVKKTDGLDCFLNDLLINESLTIKKIVSAPKNDTLVKKSFELEQILMSDFEPEDFRFLYGKTDEQLREILERYNIEIPVQGKGRNSKVEKIQHIIEYCVAQSFGRTNNYIDDAYKVTSLLPEVELFKADYGLEADTRFKSTSVSEVQDYLDRESTDNHKLALVEKEIAAEMQKEADSVKGYMTEYVSGLKGVEIKPVFSWKDAIKSVDVSFQLEGDHKPIPMSHKGAGYRRLFMVARFRYLAEKNKGLRVIYLIEEPETFLHPSAQKDLLSAFLELSDENQVIIATHSPVFVGATSIESVILCKKTNGSSYENHSLRGAQSFMDSIVDELGIKPSYNLRDKHEKIVFVESHNDARFYDLISKELIGSSLLGVDHVLVLPFGGGEDIDSFLNIDYFDGSGRELYLIIDSDKHQGKLEKQSVRASSFRDNKQKGRSYILHKSCLENYYHPRAFERMYSLEVGSFPDIEPNTNMKKLIKEYKDGYNPRPNFKEKNNFDVFGEMTKAEWQSVIETELLEFLREIVT